MKPNYFFQTIQHLRHYEEVLLFANLLLFTEQEQEEVTNYLAKAYSEEALSYPYTKPPFDEDAALWAAKTFYIAAQLLLYRENKEADLADLLPAYDKTPDASAILSADLVLRFLPDVLLQLKAIDPDDGLIPLLEEHLRIWHYSGIRYTLPPDALNFTAIVSNACLHQLYVDRVIGYKNDSLANHSAIDKRIKATLGMHASTYWSNFNPPLTIQHERD